jgi:site-specific recombinase XerD
MQATRLPRTGKRLTLAPLVDEYIRLRVVRGEYNKNTAHGYRYTLMDLAVHFGGKPLNRLTVSTIDEWFASMGAIAPTTRRVRRSAVVMFTRWLHTTKRIKVDPMVGYPKVSLPRRVPVTLPEADVAKLLNWQPDDPRALAIIWLMVGMGCRCIEVSNLDLDDYDARAGTLRIVGKFGHERILPVTAEVAEVLDAYLDDVGRVPGPLIRGREKGNSGAANYDRLSPTTISDYVNRWMKGAKVKARSYDGKSAHGLRRTAATDVMERSGRDIQLVQAMLGHARIETTTAYLSPVPIGRMREAMGGRTYRPAPPVLAAVG